MSDRPHRRVTALVQPDATTCGPTCLAVARGLTDPAYATRLSAHPRDVIAAEHRLLASVRSPAGGLQVPWPRALGTSPWALGSALSQLSGHAYRIRVLPADPSAALATVRDLMTPCAACVADTSAAGKAPGPPAALFVGSRRLPRHVTLVLAAYDEGVTLYEPSAGRRIALTQDAVAREPRVAGWPRWWLLVSPAGRGGRRTRA